MKEIIGIWKPFRNGATVFFVEDGILKKEFDLSPRRVYQRKDEIDFKKSFSARYFGEDRFLVGVDDRFTDMLLRECFGKEENEIREICGRFKAQREERTSRDRIAQKKWKELRDLFDGIVIGLDSKIDVYESGFSVRVLFGSDVSFNGKKQFLAKNKIKFVAWVMHELSQSKNAMRKIGDIKFYRPVEIINLRAQEVDVKFEVKEVA